MSITGDLLSSQLARITLDSHKIQFARINRFLSEILEQRNVISVGAMNMVIGAPSSASLNCVFYLIF